MYSETLRNWSIWFGMVANTDADGEPVADDG